MRKFIDLTGQKFGKLTIINQAEDKISKKGDHFIRWNCQCDCGESYIAYHDNLLSGATTQCKTCRYKQTASSNRQLNNYEIKENYGIGYTTNSKFFFDKKDYNLIKLLEKYYGQNVVKDIDFYKHLRRKFKCCFLTSGSSWSSCRFFAVS